MRGRNAYAYTALHPGKVEKLVIVDIGPELMAAGSARIRNGVLQKDVFEDEAEAYQIARAANPRADETESRHRLKHSLMPNGEGKWTYRYDKTLRSPERPLPRPTSQAGWAMLANITCPTLLVRGAESDLLSVEVAERMCREMANCQLVTISKAGHSVPLDNPQSSPTKSKPS
jgi:pimeloyl-ACP methyl ester carboxylesterase